MEAEEIVAAIRDMAAVKTGDVEGTPYAVVPPGYDVKLMPELREHPQRIKQNVIAHDVAGFTDYVNTFKTDTTRIFAALMPKPKLVSVLNYHGIFDGEDEPSFCSHTVSCDMQHSVEWNRWLGMDKKTMDQRTFGEFLEDNLNDVSTPPGGELLNIALNFSNIRNAEFSSALQLSSGAVQFQYLEKDTPGKVQMPSRIVLSIPVFRNGSRYTLGARLRYTLKESKLLIWYELERADLVVDQAYADVIAMVGTNTGINPFRGAP